MKTFITLFLLISLSFVSCKKENAEPLILPCAPCIPETEYYFTGVVLEECRCLQDYLYNYQMASGGYTTDDGRVSSTRIDT